MIAVSGAHSVSLISAGISYGKAPNLMQLAHAPFSTPAITKARIIYHPTYSGNFAYLEVYLAQAKAIPVSVNLIGGQGWTLVAPSTAGAVPSGYSIKELALAEGKIVANIKGYAEDIAIGGNAADLASMRGQIGDYAYDGSFDFSQEKSESNNIFIDNGNSTSRPFTGPFAMNVKIREGDTYKRWLGYFVQTVGTSLAPRAAIKSSYRVNESSPYQTAGWSKLLDEKHVGDGITVNNGIISVPEYSGATASAPGTSGLVPPAGAGEQSKVMSGSGDWISVLPLSGGTLTGNLLFPVNEDDADVKTLRLGIRAADTDGTVRNFYPIRIIPGSTVGRGLVLSTGGPIILGGGESAHTFAKGHIEAGKLTGETEYTYITSDNGIEFCYGQNAGYDETKRVYISAAGNIYMPGSITASGGFKGNSDTATKLATARTIALSGDVTASGAFDGSGNLTLTAALKNSGATAGAYGPAANATPAFGATFNVPQITVDAKGRVTAAATRTVKIPANPVATQSANGLLSAADKKKLDGFAASGIMRINYKSYQDFTLNANFTMPFDGIATLFVTGAGWGGLSLTVDGIEVGRARLYGEDNASPCDSVTAIVRSGKIVKGITKEGHGISGHVRCFKCE